MDTQAGEEQNGQGWLRIQIKVGTKPHQDCFGQSSVADPIPKLIVLFFSIHHINTEPEELVLEKTWEAKEKSKETVFRTHLRILEKNKSNAWPGHTTTWPGHISLVGPDVPRKVVCICMRVKMSVCS